MEKRGSRYLRFALYNAAKYVCYWEPTFMECFFKYLKKEEVNRRTYVSLDDLKLCLFKYINGFYNSVRPHSHNNGLSPNQAELYFQ